MNVNLRDVHLTLEYRQDTKIAKSLPFGLAACLIGLLMMTADNLEPRHAGAAYISVGIGILVIGYALWRRLSPGKPLFVLSPLGLQYRLRSSAILMPWPEIQRIETADWTQSTGGSRDSWAIRNATVIFVSKEFYESHILILRRITDVLWDNLFKPAGAMIQIGLDHEMVSVEPGAFREAIVWRWHAFRGQPAGSASSATGNDKSVKPRRASAATMMASWHRTTGRSDAAVHAPGPTPRVVVLGVKPMSTWYVAINVMLLIGIAAVLGRVLRLW